MSASIICVLIPLTNFYHSIYLQRKQIYCVLQALFPAILWSFLFPICCFSFMPKSEVPCKLHPSAGASELEENRLWHKENMQ